MNSSHHPFITPPPVEDLPFVVRVAARPEEFQALCALRAGAYSRHSYTETLPSRLSQLDEYDERAYLLFASCKDSNDCLGTMRVSFSTHGETPIAVYENLGQVEGHHYAYIDRFAVNVAANHVQIRLALMKAMWLLVCEHEIPWVVASALAPLARLYRGVGLLPIPGAEAGFLHPKLHDTAHYYMVGGPTLELHANINKRSREVARYFGEVKHPDIHIAWPPAYFADPDLAPTYLELELAKIAA